jgi:drug/metabolite transporter (DMT)-like permease
MSDLNYLIGIGFALLAGISTYIGLAIEKKAVNRIPAENRSKGFLKTLIKSRLWLLGIFIHIGLGTLFFIIAQYMIGPALVPGIMISGLVVLIIAASRIVGEKFTLTDIAGILMLVAGAILIAASRLVIDSSKIDLTDQRIIFRIISFTILILALWLASNLLSWKSTKHKALFKGLAAGFPYCIGNFWITVFYASMVPVFQGNSSTLLVVFLIFSTVILVVSNLFGITEIQSALKCGEVGFVIPIQQIPVQITPILYFYYVFMLKTTADHSLIWILGGMALIITGGFMLGKKQQALT